MTALSEKVKNIVSKWQKTLRKASVEVNRKTYSGSMPVVFFIFIKNSSWNQNLEYVHTRFHFGWKSHFGVQSAFCLCSHELRQNETQNGMDFISVILTQMKFQTGMRFSCEHNLPEKKWISANSLDIAFNAHVRLKLNAGMDFISVTLTEMKFYFRW